MGISGAPLDRRMEAIEDELDICRKYLISTFESDSETHGEPGYASIVAAIEGRTAHDQSGYSALIKKLEDEELSEVSNSRCRQFVCTIADINK
jgi:hypothetical protein